MLHALHTTFSDVSRCYGCSMYSRTRDPGPRRRQAPTRFEHDDGLQHGPGNGHGLNAVGIRPLAAVAREGMIVSGLGCACAPSGRKCTTNTNALTRIGRPRWGAKAFERNCSAKVAACSCARSGAPAG